MNERETMSPRKQQGIPGLYGGDARGLYGSRSYGQRGTMIYGKQPSPRGPKYVLAVLIVVIIVLCVRQFACGGILPHDDSAAQQEQQQEQQATQVEDTSAQVEEDASTAAVSGTVKITAVGDCTLGTDVDFETDTNFDTVYKKNDASYFFKRALKYTGEDDLTIANLEGPLTSVTEATDKGENSYNFRGNTSYTKILQKGSVEVVNLANNHSFDYGSDGYTETKKVLDKAKIGYACGDLVYTKTVNNIKVGFFGINATAGYDDAASMLKQDIKTLEGEDCDLIIAEFHWGTEGNYDPDTEQVELAHKAIDAGANLVIGAHPHVLQGIEVYKDAYILYSMGNFVFGGNDNPRDYATMLFQMTFTFENDELVADTSLKSAQIIPFRLSTSKTINNYQPIAVGGDEGVSIVKDINKRSKALKGSGAEFSTKLDDNIAAKVK